MNLFFTNTVSPYSIIEYSDYEYLKKMSLWAQNAGDCQNRSTNVKADMTQWQIWKETDLFNKFLSEASKEIISLSWVQNNKDFLFSNVWAAVYRKGDYATIHDHILTYISFVVCLDDGGLSHPLVFSDSNIQVEMITGRIVVFPSYVKHHVPVYYGESPRVVLAGNIIEDSS